MNKYSFELKKNHRIYNMLCHGQFHIFVFLVANKVSLLSECMTMEEEEELHLAEYNVIFVK